MLQNFILQINFVIFPLINDLFMDDYNQSDVNNAMITNSNFEHQQRTTIQITLNYHAKKQVLFPKKIVFYIWIAE